MSGSGISWAVCKSAPCFRQITTAAPHHSVFYRPDALPAAQPTAAKHWKHATNGICSASKFFSDKNVIKFYIKLEVDGKPMQRNQSDNDSGCTAPTDRRTTQKHNASGPTYRIDTRLKTENIKQKCANTAGSMVWLFPMLKYKYIFSNKICRSNFIKQHSKTAMVWNQQNANCRLKNKFIVSFIVIFGMLSFPMLFSTEGLVRCARVFPLPFQWVCGGLSTSAYLWRRTVRPRSWSDHVTAAQKQQAFYQWTPTTAMTTYLLTCTYDCLTALCPGHLPTQ